MSVLLPFELDGVPAGLTYVVSDEPAELPQAVLDEVELYVMPYAFDLPNREVIARMPRLKVVQTQSAGVDHVRGSIPEGVLLCSGRGIHDTATAELAVALTLAGLNQLPEFRSHFLEGEWRPHWREGLADRRVLVVGAGSIGQAIRARLEPFECEVTMAARTARDSVHGVGDLPALLPDADVVILILPETAETVGLFDAAMIARMRHSALLVNVARGPIVEAQALLDALRGNRIRAAVDVTDPEPLPAGHPLWGAPNLILTPHVGGMSEAFHRRTRALVRRQVERLAAGERPANVVTGDY